MQDYIIVIMNDLHGYKEFCALRKTGIKPKHLGMHGRTGDVHRLNARLRVAKSLVAIELEGYTASTAGAYGAMLRTFLCYTCFEQFAYLLDCRPYAFVYEYPDHPYDAVAHQIRKHDKKWKFADALIEYLEPGGVRNALMDFKTGEKNNPLNFALGIRHTFSHGRLTANTKGANPVHVKFICDQLSSLLVHVIDGEFERIVMRRYRDNVEESST